MQQPKLHYVYLLREREFIRMNESIYKIGKTKQKPRERFNGYPKNSQLIRYIRVDDCDVTETEIKRVFTEKFTKKDDIGQEYFEGDIDMINEEFMIIVRPHEIPDEYQLDEILPARSIDPEIKRDDKNENIIVIPNQPLNIEPIIEVNLEIKPVINKPLKPKKITNSLTVYFIRITKTSISNFENTILARIRDNALSQWGFKKGNDSNKGNMRVWTEMKNNIDKTLVLFGCDKNNIFYLFKLLKVYEDETVAKNNWGDGAFSLIIDIEKMVGFKYTFSQFKNKLGYSESFPAQGPLPLKSDKIELLKSIPEISIVIKSYFNE